MKEEKSDPQNLGMELEALVGEELLDKCLVFVICSNS